MTGVQTCALPISAPFHIKNILEMGIFMYSKKFFRFVMPSILAFALSGIYSIVDGYFVGNNVGDAGMTAINVVFPVVSILQALGTGIGMGGSIQYSILKAAEKRKMHLNIFVPQ